MKTNHQRQFTEKVTRYVGKSRNGDNGFVSAPRLGTCGCAEVPQPSLGAYSRSSERNIGNLPGTKCFGEYSKLSRRTVSAVAYTHDTTCGKHGVAKNIRGAKKYVRSRIRFHENTVTRRLGMSVDLLP